MKRFLNYRDSLRWMDWLGQRLPDHNGHACNMVAWGSAFRAAERALESEHPYETAWEVHRV